MTSSDGNIEIYSKDLSQSETTRLTDLLRHQPQHHSFISVLLRQSNLHHVASNIIVFYNTNSNFIKKY